MSADGRETVRVALDIRVLQGEDAHRGIGNYTRGLAQALDALADPGLEIVHLVDGRASEPAIDRVGKAARIDMDGFRPRGLLGRVAGSPDASATARAAARCGAHVLHVCSPLHGHFDWKPMRRGGATVATVYDLIPLDDRARFLDRWPAAARNRYLRRLTALRKIDRLFAISRAAAHDLERLGGIDPGRIDVLYPALRVELECLAEPMAERTRSAPRENGYVMGFASLNPSKNTEAVLRGYSLLDRAARRKHPLLLCATPEASLAEWLRESAKRFGIADEMVLRTGTESDGDLAALYAGAALFALPSTMEGFGLPALEAMAFGVPVAASGIPVLREVLDEAGEYFDPLDPVSIAHALASMLGDRARRERMAEAGRLRVRRFSWHRTAWKAARAYRELAGMQ